MRPRNLPGYALLSLLVIAVDQISKSLIVTKLSEGETISVIGDFLYFQFIYNEGGAMGTRLGPSWVYLILTFLAIFIIGKYFWEASSDGKGVKIPLSIILGGAVGNLIDRIRFGKVVDFIDIDFPDIPAIHLYRWFTFNLADAAITIGLVILIAGIIFRKNASDPAGGDLPCSGSEISESDTT